VNLDRFCTTTHGSGRVGTRPGTEKQRKLAERIRNISGNVDIILPWRHKWLVFTRMTRELPFSMTNFKRQSHSEQKCPMFPSGKKILLLHGMDKEKRNFFLACWWKRRDFPPFRRKLGKAHKVPEYFNRLRGCDAYIHRYYDQHKLNLYSVSLFESCFWPF